MTGKKKWGGGGREGNRTRLLYIIIIVNTRVPIRFGLGRLEVVYFPRE